MIFHLAYEIPRPRFKVLDSDIPQLTPEEVRILKDQIRKNSVLIEDYVYRLDLLVNKEGHPYRETFVKKIRERLHLLMEENDTFRQVLWKHVQREALMIQYR
ncbi:MAG: hypothetical protein NC930_04320 [Candidatus Omnitrophica bacterium]|nr:hypothetical protein [Candidatus Omnitrophota bacterium]